MINETLIGKLYPVWFSSQTDLFEVKRWSSFLSENKGLRNQSTLAHTLSFSIVANVAVLHLMGHIYLDEALLQRAFNIHDLPEGFLGRDVLATKKTDENDLAEYVIFMDKFSHLPEKILAEYEKSFLLQFARKNPACFPERSRKIMFKLVENHPYEVLVFEALEKWEYIFYAWESYQNKTHPNLFILVLRRQIPELQQFAKTIPGFRQEIFTYDFENWALSFVEKNKDIS